MKKRNHATHESSVGEEIIAGLEEALAYERGELANAKVTRTTLASHSVEVAAAPAYRASRISALRGGLRLSQPIFAAALNVSPETVKKWEQGTREPDGAALRLLELAEQHPQWILDRLHSVDIEQGAHDKRIKAKFTKTKG